MDNPTFLGQPRTQQLTLIPGYGVRYRPLWEPRKNGGTKGSKIWAIGITSRDAGANRVRLAIGKALTSQPNMGTAAFIDNGVSPDAITRTAGSFVADGWRIGEIMVAQGATTLANDFQTTLTGVSASQLTFATATVAAAEDLVSTTKLMRVQQLGLIDVAAQAGTVSGTPSVSGLVPAEMPWILAAPNDYMTIADDDVLLAAADVQLDASETMEITVWGADY